MRSYTKTAHSKQIAQVTVMDFVQKETMKQPNDRNDALTGAALNRDEVETARPRQTRQVSTSIFNVAPERLVSLCKVVVNRQRALASKKRKRVQGRTEK